MWIAVLVNSGAFVLALRLVGPVQAVLSAWEAYEATVRNSRYHRHREGRSVRDTLALAASRPAVPDPGPLPVAGEHLPPWADLVTAEVPALALAA